MCLSQLPGIGATEEKLSLSFVPRQLGRALELGGCLVRAARFLQEVAADAGEEVVVGKGLLVADLVEEGQARLGAEGHAQGHRAVQLDDGGRLDGCESLVKGCDSDPVGFLGSDRPRVAGGYRGL